MTTIETILLVLLAIDIIFNVLLAEHLRRTNTIYRPMHDILCALFDRDKEGAHALLAQIRHEETNDDPS
jgi:hypothetical protein